MSGRTRSNANGPAVTRTSRTTTSTTRAAGDRITPNNATSAASSSSANTRRRPRSSLTNTMSLAPTSLLENLNLNSHIETTTSMPRRSTRVQELKAANPPPAPIGNSRPPASFTRQKRTLPVQVTVLSPNASTLIASPAGSSPRNSRSRGRKSAARSSLGGKPQMGSAPSQLSFLSNTSSIGLSVGDSIIDTTQDEEQTSEMDDDDEDEEWGIVDRMRLWRHDAMTQHLYETAIFWGDKVMGWTNDPSDAFWLAQVHFQTGQYARAERLLTRPFPTKPPSLTPGDGENTTENLQEDSNTRKTANFSLFGPRDLSNTTSGSISMDATDSFGISPLAKHSVGTNSGIAMAMGPTKRLLSFFRNPAPQLPANKTVEAGPLNFLSTRPMSHIPPISSNLNPLGKIAPVSQFNAGFNGPAPLKGGIDLESMMNLNLDNSEPELEAGAPPSMGLPASGSGLGITNAAGLPLTIKSGEVFGLGNGYAGAAGELMVDAEMGYSRLVDMSVMCRYLAAQCQVRQGKYAEALEVLGEENPFRENASSGPDVPNRDGGIKLEASMCYLRGTVYMRLNRSERAKQCFLEALALDVKCFEAFNMLVESQMLTIDEEWDLTQNLRYKEQTPDDAEFVQMMYTVRLKKLKHADEIALSRRRLTTEYGLGDNCDLLHTLADSLYAQFRWADCFAVTSRIMELTQIHLPTIPLHVACMYHLKHLHSRLFLLAHELVDKEPESPMSWYAVGIWYFVSGRWREARQYLSKTTIMDPRHATGWVAFAHTFASEGEHEHAITAYSTCARLFHGSHLPYLFIGMEHLTLSNVTLAEDALEAAHDMCDSDPLVFNERGVAAFLKSDYQTAVGHFEKAIELANVVQGSEANWISTFCNLGTAQRKLGRFDNARKAYDRVLAIEPRHANALASLGMVEHICGEYGKAIQRYHEALSIEPLDTNILELLNMALATQTSPNNSLFRLPSVSEKLAARTQRMHEREAVYLKQIRESEDKEDVPWDKPYHATLSAWST